RERSHSRRSERLGGGPGRRRVAWLARDHPASNRKRRRIRGYARALFGRGDSRASGQGAIALSAGHSTCGPFSLDETCVRDRARQGGLMLTIKTILCPTDFS